MILVLAEHRKGKIRDITFEMLSKANELAQELETKTSVLLLADKTKKFVDNLKMWVDEILICENNNLKNFNADIYRHILGNVIKDRKPNLTLVGHSSVGMDIAPAISVDLDIPLISNVTDINKNQDLFTVRQIYGGKIHSKVSFRKGEPRLITVQAGSFQFEEPPNLSGDLEEIHPPINEDRIFRKFLELVEPEEGEIDISSSERIIAVGRGIGEEENLDEIKELADLLDADIAGSRPVIDNGWLPDNRQVGQSGKTVKPKLYIAIGISGQSNHVIGMKGSDTIVALNKDPDAPIFRIADYGIVDDFLNIVPPLIDKMREN